MRGLRINPLKHDICLETDRGNYAENWNQVSCMTVFLEFGEVKIEHVINAREALAIGKWFTELGTQLKKKDLLASKIKPSEEE